MNLFKLISAIVISISMGACSELEEAYDCAYVCDQYSVCFDDQYDVSGCVTTCEDEADASEVYAERVNGCQTCIDNQSCDDTFACATECANIVP